MRINTFFFLLTFLCTQFVHADDRPVIRLGVMAGGTLAWELAAMQKQGLVDTANFKLETMMLANQQAGKIALQGGSADIIVADWFWVANMRNEGAEYSFYPFSSSVGGLIVPANSPINSLADLKDKKLGVAGGELDKNWLLLQTLATQQGMPLQNNLMPVFAAPPLLNQQLTENRIDAVLTYWQFAVRLEANGYRQLMSGEDIIRELGVSESVPSLGYVFKQSWATQNSQTLRDFINTAANARNNLCSNQQEWDKISSLTEAGDEKTSQLLKQRYCQGHLNHWQPANLDATAYLYKLLMQANSKFNGKSVNLPEGTFWSID